MTSGLPYDDAWGAVTFGYDDQELEAYLGRGVRMAGSPGSEYRHSNLGFALLGKIVERVTQAGFEQYVAREVFASLAMTSSGFVASAIGTGRVPATGLFAEKSRHTELATRLAREHLMHGNCQRGQAEHDDGNGKRTSSSCAKKLGES